MEYICPICKEKIPREVGVIIPHTEIHIVDAIKKTHPEWVAKDGSCKACYAWYKKEMKP